MKKGDKTKRARILIVDDHPAVRDALSTWVGKHPDLEVCGEAADVSAAMQLASSSLPDLAVVDISLKKGDGIELIKRFREKLESIRILVWSTHNESFYAERVLRAGAMGYIQKDQPMDQFMTAIRSILAGKVYLSEEMTQKLLGRSIGVKSQETSRNPIEVLADRELEVFRLIGEGLKTAEIAQRLHLSVHTIETYRERIKTKLDMKNSSRLGQFATQWVLENG